MKIKKSVEMPDGSYVYQGEFTGPELDYLVEYAVNLLLAHGAFPFTTEETVEESGFPMPEVSTEQ